MKYEKQKLSSVAGMGTQKNYQTSRFLQNQQRISTQCSKSQAPLKIEVKMSSEAWDGSAGWKGFGHSLNPLCGVLNFWKSCQEEKNKEEKI